MNVAFYIAAAVAVLATLMTITRSNPVHALLYLVVSLLSVALVFYVLGAPFIAALEVIIYAGAIVVLLVFVVILLNLSPESVRRETQWLRPSVWVGPSALALLLLIELVYLSVVRRPLPATLRPVAPQEVGLTLFGPYLLGVELASILLLAGLVGAWHIGRKAAQREDES